MTFTEEFEQQWSSLTACLTSEILRSADTGKAVSYEQLVELFNNEKKRWTVRGQYQNAWFELLGKENPEVAAEFEKALDSIKLMAKPLPIVRLYSQSISNQACNLSPQMYLFMYPGSMILWRKMAC